jgi:rhodanese-related sulfurtransferase
MKFIKLAITVLFFTGSISVAKEPEKIAPVKIEQAEKRLIEGDQLLDVRTKEEWEEGHLKEATLITVTEPGFLEKAKAALDPKKGVVVYCRSGKRSAMAVEQLRAAGFTVYDLAGGITAWEAAGKPVVKASDKIE